MTTRFIDLFGTPLLLAACIVLFTAKANADLTLYTDLTTFNNDLAANGYVAQTLNFDSEVAGTTYSDPSTIGHITFSNFPTPDLLVTADFETTSGLNYLGVDSLATANQFLGGYEFDMGFAASNAIGLNIVTGEIPNLSIFDNDIQLVVPGVGTALLDVDDLQQNLPLGDSVFFLGVIDTMQTFTTAEIRYDPAAVFAVTYNIDDITTAQIPEPQTAMILLVISGFTCCRRRRGSEMRNM